MITAIAKESNRQPESAGTLAGAEKTNHCTATGACTDASESCKHYDVSFMLGGCMSNPLMSRRCLSPYALHESQSGQIVDAVFDFCDKEGVCTASGQVQETMCVHNPDSGTSKRCGNRSPHGFCQSAAARKASRQ